MYSKEEAFRKYVRLGGEGGGSNLSVVHSMKKWLDFLNNRDGVPPDKCLVSC